MNQQSDVGITIGKIVFIFLGLGMMITAILIAKNVYHFTKNGVKVQGRVIEMNKREAQRQSTEMTENTDEDSFTTHSAIFEFETLDGETLTTKSKIRTNPPLYAVGDLVTIIYQKENPSNARIDKFIDLYFLPLLLGGMGFLLFTLGIVAFVLFRPR